MPYPFVPGETLTSANLNAALDMRVRTDGANLALTPGAVLYGSSGGGFGSDVANLIFDATNDRLGVGHPAPTATLTVGRSAGAARVYNSYTDAANGEWAELAWAGNVLMLGSNKNGTGLARDVAVYHGGTQKLWLTSDGFGVGQSPGGSGAGNLLRLGGTLTTTSNALFLLNSPTLVSSVTSSQYAFSHTVIFQPSGASLSTAYGVLNEVRISGSTTIPVTQIVGFSSALTTLAGYTQQTTTGIAYDVFGPTIGGTLPFTNYYAFRAQGTTNGNGITSGTVTNIGVIISPATAAAAAGGTINNYGYYTTIPTGSGAGTTTNYGLRIAGPGGSGGAGTTTNWALYSDSTANSVFFGRLGLNGTTPTIPLQLAGTFTDATQVALVSMSSTMVLAPTGSQYGIVCSPTFQPSGASLTQAVGVLANPKLAGSVAIAEVDAAYVRTDFGTYSGTNPNIITGISVDNPAGGSATKFAVNCFSFYSLPISNAHGATTGTINNGGLFVGAITSGAAGTANVFNYGAFLTVPSGGGAGNTVNHGLYLTGNGGSGGGSVQNYAIGSISTAHSYIQGGLRIGNATANPTNATSPFLYITAAAGVPTGVPAFAAAGAIAVQWDSTNKKLMVYDQPSATWKGVVLA